MAPPKRHDRREKPSSSSSASSLPTEFYTAISTVAVSQICVTVGFSSAEPSAVRALVDVAAAYVRTLARSAAGSANSRGRTESNLFDLVRAVEELSIHCGFAGASDPTRPLLRSSAVKELRDFVWSVDEVPFPKPIRRKGEEEGERSSVRVRVPEEEEGVRMPPPPHVPRWLPSFPEKWTREERKREREKERLRWEEAIVLGFGGDSEGSGIRVSTRRKGSGSSELVPAERGRVRFKLGLGFGKEEEEEEEEKRRKGVLTLGDWEDDDDKVANRRRF